MNFIVFSIEQNKGYLKREAPVGSVRLSLLQPKKFTAAKDLEYCLLPGEKSKSKLQCEYWDANGEFGMKIWDWERMWGGGEPDLW